MQGLELHKTVVETSSPAIRMTYFRNLVFDGSILAVLDKPCGNRTFGSFIEYRTFLENSLAAIGSNMRDPLRKHTFAPLGTLSKGYDSPAVAALSKSLGNTEVLTFRHGRGATNDDGSAIASVLGLRSIPLDREAWRQESLAAAPFIAANAYGEEVHYTAAKSILDGHLLLTGYHGDKVWSSSPHDVSPHIKRGDPSGLALTEWRLWVGFLHCPAPFFGVRKVDQMYRISVSGEMKPWSVGGDYAVPFHAASSKNKAFGAICSGNIRARPASSFGILKKVSCRVTR